MFRLILVACIIYFLWQWLRRSASPASKPRAYEPPANQKVEEMVQDPVCGTWVPVSQALPLLLDKKTLYFCCAACRDKFLQPPADNKL